MIYHECERMKHHTPELHYRKSTIEKVSGKCLSYPRVKSSRISHILRKLFYFIFYNLIVIMGENELELWMFSLEILKCVNYFWHNLL